MAFVPRYILILGITIVVDYFAGIIISRMQGKSKRIFLIVSLITNIGMLFVFKYFNFFNENIKHLSDLLNWNYPISSLSIILPIGLSFHTFQSMSYIIEVYRGKQEPEKHFGIYALYVMYYPQLVAGPIERPQNMLWQFHKEHSFDAQRVSDGLKLTAWGFFKKIVIADNLALVVNSVYGNPTSVNGFSLVIATYFFAFQIFCDFSGYTDIARGASRVMGIELMQNFKRPYFSKTISEFWRRWHISLSSWFTDYVYIPLGGNRCAKWKWFHNTMIVFLLSGLWHGANWTYVIWGGLNGFYLVFAIISKNIRGKITKWTGIDKFPNVNKMVKVFCTFNLICFSWIFFRASSFTEAVTIIKRIFMDFSLKIDIGRAGVSRYQLSLCFGVIVLLLAVQLFQRNKKIINELNTQHVVYRWIIYYSALIFIIIFGVFNTSSFIYFQF
ncbi:MBOAT family O-acyltransferase [Clostridium sp. BNL1100]|uniref:MBOAT family O-acyltransferase n=1 Tax=Clostridium sp. BNL1100 TaxID=755731 RepID=UPI001FA7EB0F|nr:MBOAT family O-acyltransferase [Clostridium sp. BNL1100]